MLPQLKPQTRWPGGHLFNNLNCPVLARGGSCGAQPPAAGASHTLHLATPPPPPSPAVLRRSSLGCSTSMRSSYFSSSSRYRQVCLNVSLKKPVYLNTAREAGRPIRLAVAPATAAACVGSTPYPRDVTPACPQAGIDSCCAGGQPPARVQI